MTKKRRAKKESQDQYNEQKTTQTAAEKKAIRLSVEFDANFREVEKLGEYGWEVVISTKNPLQKWMKWACKEYRVMPTFFTDDHQPALTVAQKARLDTLPHFTEAHTKPCAVRRERNSGLRRRQAEQAAIAVYRGVPSTT